MKKLRFRFYAFWLLTAAAIFYPPVQAGPGLGNPLAPKGGTFTIGLPFYPKHLIYYISYDEQSLAVNWLVLESLIEMDMETYEPIPLLASNWTISADKKSFTFKLNPAAKFSDGKPVTAEDVVFTWETIFNPKNQTAPFQSLFASFESCKALDPHTVLMKVKTVHFKNLEKLKEFFILPKHFYSQGDFTKNFTTKMLGSGPYTVDEVVQNERIVLKRNPSYWGIDLPQNKGRYNFDKVVFKAASDLNVQFESFKRGDLDYFYFTLSKMWTMDTGGPPFQKGYLKKLKAENLLPYGTQGIAWNLRKPLFQDRKVRLALSHLMNRERYIKDLFYDNYLPATGAVSMTSEYHSPKNIPVPYDPKKAKQLLKEAGWEKSGSDGVLVKDGKRFEFDLMTDNPANQRYLTVYQEDLKQMGIKMNIRTLDWATVLRLMDDRQFDATDVNRSREVHPSDIAVEWGSKEADIKGSANLAGYKNKEVDKIAAQVDETFDKTKRVALVRRFDEILGHDQPFSFAWQPKYTRLGYWNRFSFPGKGFFNYSQWKSAFHYWWYDAEKDARLKKAMAEGSALE